MRVMLLGATGNLGLRLIPALIAHKHIVTAYIRNIPKLHSLISETLLNQIEAVVEGDATDSAAIKQAIIDHDIEAIINVAGTKVKPGEEFIFPKIAKAISDAAVAVGKERGRPLRVWVTAGLGILEHPGTKYLIQDYFPRDAMDQHEATRDVMEAVPLQDLRWSLLAISMMHPLNPEQGLFEPLDASRPHDLLAKATSPPGWDDTYVDIAFHATVTYATKYEAVADFLAQDLELGNEEWVGMKVGLKEKSGEKDI